MSIAKITRRPITFSMAKGAPAPPTMLSIFPIALRKSEGFSPPSPANRAKPLGKGGRDACVDVQGPRPRRHNRTPQTHLRNIYAKLNVHTQKDLVDLVEREKQSLLEQLPSWYVKR